MSSRSTTGYPGSSMLAMRLCASRRDGVTFGANLHVTQLGLEDVLPTSPRALPQPLVRTLFSAVFGFKLRCSCPLKPTCIPFRHSPPGVLIAIPMKRPCPRHWSIQLLLSAMPMILCSHVPAGSCLNLPPRDFLPRSTGQIRMCAFLRGKGHAVRQRHQLYRKSGYQCPVWYECPASNVNCPVQFVLRLRRGQLMGQLSSVLV